MTTGILLILAALVAAFCAGYRHQPRRRHEPMYEIDGTWYEDESPLP